MVLGKRETDSLGLGVQSVQNNSELCVQRDTSQNEGGKSHRALNFNLRPQTHTQNKCVGIKTACFGEAAGDP